MILCFLQIFFSFSSSVNVLWVFPLQQCEVKTFWQVNVILRAAQATGNTASGADKPPAVRLGLIYTPKLQDSCCCCSLQDIFSDSFVLVILIHLSMLLHFLKANQFLNFPCCIIIFYWHSLPLTPTFTFLSYLHADDL